MPLNERIKSIPRRIYWRILAAPRYLLKYKFGIKGFHLSPAQQKRYCLGIVKHLNQRKVRSSVLDVGCGLGDVLRKLDFNRRVGLDHKQEVLDALKFISRFSLFDKSNLELHRYEFDRDPIVGKYDAIVICNWIHNIEPEVLRDKFEKMFTENLNAGGELVFDIVSTEEHFYPFTHDVNFLNASIDAKVHIIGRYENDNMAVKGVREIISLEKAVPG